MPAPRACSAAGDRSKTRTSQPASRSTRAAVSPPTDPPAMLTRGMLDTGCTPSCCVPCSWSRPQGPGASGPPEGGDADHVHLEQHPPLVEGRITQPVGRLVTGVL